MTRGYEVRVEGELGESLLRFLGWSSRVEPAHTTIRLDTVSASDLHRFLEACAGAGMTIEKVTKV